MTTWRTAGSSRVTKDGYGGVYPSLMRPGQVRGTARCAGIADSTSHVRGDAGRRDRRELALDLDAGRGERHDAVARGLVEQQPGDVGARVVPRRVGRGLGQRDHAEVEVGVDDPLGVRGEGLVQEAPVGTED